MLDGTDVSSGNECVKWKRQAEVRVMTPFPILYFLPQSAIISSCRHTQNHVHCEWSHSVNGKIPEYSSSPYGSVGTCDCSVSSYPDDICCGFAFQTGLVSLLESMAGSITVSNHLTSLTPQSDMHVCVCLDIVIVVVWMTHPPPIDSHIWTLSLWLKVLFWMLWNLLDTEPWWKKYDTENGL